MCAHTSVRANHNHKLVHAQEGERGKKKIATLIFVPSYALVTPLPPPLHCDRGLVGGGGEWRGGLLFSSISPENPRPDSKYVRYCVVYY